MEQIVTFISELSSKYPLAVGILSILYCVGIGFKVLLTAFKAYVLESPSTADDVFAKNLEENKIFKGFKFVMDLLIRVKIK